MKWKEVNVLLAEKLCTPRFLGDFQAGRGTHIVSVVSAEPTGPRRRTVSGRRDLLFLRGPTATAKPLFRPACNRNWLHMCLFEVRIQFAQLYLLEFRPPGKAGFHCG